MAEPALLFITSDRLVAYRWRRGQVAREGAFAADEPGRRAFAAYAAGVARRGRTAWLLADLVEEDFRFDTVPHVLGPGRSALLERKLEQLYRSTPFRHAEIREREQEGRRDDRVLFSALTNPHWIAPWVELLTQYKIPLRGIYSVPLVSRRIAKLVPDNELLLITWERDAGVRQTYFKNGHVSFSRLSPLAVGLPMAAGLSLAGDPPSVGDAQLTPTVLKEAARTIQYLQSLSLLPAGRPLPVVIVCSARDKQALGEQLQNTARVRYAYLDIGELAARLQYRGPLPDSDCTALLLHVLAKGRLPNQYATAQHRHYHALGKTRRFAQAAVLVAGFGLLLEAGLDLWRAVHLSRQAEALSAQLQRLDHQYRALHATLPQTPLSAAEMRRAVLSLRTLSQASPLPLEVLGDLGQTLAQFPGLQVNHLTWQITSRPDRVQDDLLPAAASPGPQATGRGPTLYRVVQLQGEVRPFHLNDREALKQVEALQAELIRRGMSVEPIELPLDLRPQVALRGELDVPDAPRRATFALKIVQTAGP